MSMDKYQSSEDFKDELKKRIKITWIKIQKILYDNFSKRQM